MWPPPPLAAAMRGEAAMTPTQMDDIRTVVEADLLAKIGVCPADIPACSECNKDISFDLATRRTRDSRLLCSECEALETDRRRKRPIRRFVVGLIRFVCCPWCCENNYF